MKTKEVSEEKERKVWERANQLILASMIADNPPKDTDLYSGQPVWPSGVPQDVAEDNSTGETYIIRAGRVLRCL